MMARLAAFGTRTAVRLAVWRAGRREADRDLRIPRDQVFRGFIQVNLIRPR